MVCPVCKTEARISGLPQAIKKGEKYYNRMIFECRNKNCSSFGTEIGKEDIEFEVEVVEEEAEVEVETEVETEAETENETEAEAE